VRSAAWPCRAGCNNLHLECHAGVRQLRSDNAPITSRLSIGLGPAEGVAVVEQLCGLATLNRGTSLGISGVAKAAK
jgi:hypothetical protein